MLRALTFSVLLAAGCANAQIVSKCVMPNGRVVYTDALCPASSVGGASLRTNSRANVIDGSELRETAERTRLEREEREREMDAASAAFQRSADEQRHEKTRRELLRAATTPHPGARGLTRAQRETAASLARTQKERDELMREASTSMPGANGGLTASQLDAQRRLSAANRGETMLPPYQPADAIHHQHPAPPSQLVNCDGAGCWDTSGRRYNNAAGGFSRSDGAFCTKIAGGVSCN